MCDFFTFVYVNKKTSHANCVRIIVLRFNAHDDTFSCLYQAMQTQENVCIKSKENCQ